MGEHGDTDTAQEILASWQRSNLAYEEQRLAQKEREVTLKEREAALDQKLRAKNEQRVGAHLMGAFFAGVAAALTGTFGFYWFTALFGAVAIGICIHTFAVIAYD